ncbi:hypothetical protein PGTUg99_020013 [Puccinia graminis f. sp. tritici]|uniref:Uncharacterized protein n=1 Tax=Puccinia graminis f. sp. tritici TaxID=56615 RepID=A0A5B0S780_PUCGR|nr:hypothetical protein PGTUg99_020013 [Puccinia graminis f. sp. tritici]
MYGLLQGNSLNSTDGSTWDPTSMHIRCICHKLALIVNARLAALALKTLPLAKAKESVLGFFPVLGRLMEEKEEEGTEALKAPEVEVLDGPEDVINIPDESDRDYGNADDEGSDYDVPNPALDDPSGDKGTPNQPSATSTKTASQNKHTKTSRLLELTNKVSMLLSLMIFLEPVKLTNYISSML